MTFRYVLVVLAGILFAAVVFTIANFARFRPNHYKFLGSNRPKEVTLEPDPIGVVGREARYYVLHEDPAVVTLQAQTELAGIGWKELSSNPVEFGRGSHERIDVSGADKCRNPKLLEGIPHDQLSAYSIVKVVDPRMPPTIRQRIVHWTRHPFRGFFGRFV